MEDLLGFIYFFTFSIPFINRNDEDKTYSICVSEKEMMIYSAVGCVQ